MFMIKLIVGTALNMGIFCGLLFLSAGTLQWSRAWVIFGLFLFGSILTIAGIIPLNKDLLAERLKSPIQKGQPPTDKIIVILFISAYLGLIVFLGLDMFHFHLLQRPGPVVSSLGLVIVVGGWWIIYLSLKENIFAAPAVKYQKEREQRVIDTGVYSVVRHPMYSGTGLMLIGLSLWLESYAAALLSGIPIGLLAVRIVYEERFLRQELKGYDAYLKKVRYRLIPLLW
jgi:protein-S-isoprenylcysteine O-methyltransferase Ste14